MLCDVAYTCKVSGHKWVQGGAAGYVQKCANCHKHKQKRKKKKKKHPPTGLGRHMEAWEDASRQMQAQEVGTGRCGWAMMLCACHKADL